MIKSNKLNVDLSDADNVVCEKCQKNTFSPTFVIKRLSALVSPSGQETFIPVQLFKCDSCNHINKLFLEGLTN